MGQKSIEDILAGIELAVSEVIKPESLNVWVSARERSITGILKQCGVNMNLSSAFLEELRNVGLIDTALSGAGLRYMVKSSEIPDAQFLARKIYDNFKDRYAKGRVNDGYPTSSKRDLRPLKSKDNKKIDENGSPKYVPIEIARLGDIGYVVRDNVVYEVMIIGIAYDTYERKRVLYTVENYRGKNSEGQDVYNVISNVGCREFHRTVESALAAMRVFKYVKRSNK